MWTLLTAPSMIFALTLVVGIIGYVGYRDWKDS